MDELWRRRVTYFSSPRKLIAEEALLEERLAFNVASCNLSWSTAVKASSASALTILFTVGSLVACAGPEPILRSNTQLQLYGKEAAEREVGICEIKAERAGLQHGTNRSGNAGADGLIIEVHAEPEKALCDGAQSLYPSQFVALMDELRIIVPAVRRGLA